MRCYENKTKNKMTNEQLRMQMLAGVITESEYKVKLEKNKEKDSVNENFVGMQAINSPFLQRENEKYEDAFEHFLSGKYGLNSLLNESENEYDGLNPDDYDQMEDGSLVDPESGKTVWTPTQGKLNETL